MSTINRNIPLDHAHTFTRNLNITHGIWVIFLLSRGFSMIHIGLFESLFHLSSIVFEVPTGIVADLYGRKFSRMCALVIGVSYFIILLFFSSIWMVSLGFILLGLSYTFESGSGEALIYDTLKTMGKEDTFARFNGRKEVVYQVAAMISLVIGGAVASVAYELNFEIMIGVFIIAMIITSFMVEIKQKAYESMSIFKRFKHHFLDSTKAVYQNKKLFYLIILSSLFAAPVTTIFFFAQEFFLNLSFTKIEIGIFLGLHSLTAAVGGLLAYRIEKYLGEKRTLYLVPLFIGSCFVLMMFPRFYTVGFVIIGFFDSLFFVVMSDYVNKITSSDKRATILSFGGFMFSVVMIVLFPLFGWIVDVFDMIVANIILAMIVGVLYGVLALILRSIHFNKAL
jgi:MFS family permease